MIMKPCKVKKEIGLVPCRVKWFNTTEKTQCCTYSLKNWKIKKYRLELIENHVWNNTGLKQNGIGSMPDKSRNDLRFETGKRLRVEINKINENLTISAELKWEGHSIFFPSKKV